MGRQLTEVSTSFHKSLFSRSIVLSWKLQAHYPLFLDSESYWALLETCSLPEKPWVQAQLHSLFLFRMQSRHCLISVIWHLFFFWRLEFHYISLCLFFPPSPPIHVYIPKYILFNVCNVTCLHVIMTDHLATGCCALPQEGSPLPLAGFLVAFRV